MNYQSHIKSSYLKSLVQADTSCEQKIQSIEKLLGLPVSESVESGVTGNDNELSQNEADAIADNANQDAVLDKRLKAHERILEGLSGKSEKLAKGLLQRIESLENISYDYNNLEISINSEVKKYSSIRSLIHRTVQVASPNLPLHFTEFINALLMSKTLISFFVNSDALNIRQGLIRIHKAKNVALGGNSEVSPSDDTSVVQTNENDVNQEVQRNENESDNEVIKEGETESGGNESEENLNGIRKRKRDEENDDEVRDGKRKKSVTFDVSTDVGVSGKGKRKREEKEDEEVKVGKKKKTEKKVKPVVEGQRRSKRVELKSKLKKDWISNN